MFIMVMIAIISIDLLVIIYLMCFAMFTIESYLSWDSKSEQFKLVVVVVVVMFKKQQH